MVIAISGKDHPLMALTVMRSRFGSCVLARNQLFTMQRFQAREMPKRLRNWRYTCERAGGFSPP